MAKRRIHGADPEILAMVKKLAQEAYGPRIERIVLFASRARGDGLRGSDYDIAIFLYGMKSIWDE